MTKIKFAIPDPVLENILNARKTGFEAFKNNPRNADLCPLTLRIAYECERAPLTTNKEQVQSCGLAVPDPLELDIEELPAVLDRIIRCLADAWRVHIVNTDHLTDEELYDRLYNCTLVEPIRQGDPTDTRIREFVDLTNGEPNLPKVADRDRHYAV
jgi:hypothetical protein